MSLNRHRGLKHYKPVERLWPGETAVIIASGPSLTQDDVNFVRGKARTIVINTSYKLAPWADVLYACDARWWGWNLDALKFAGMRFSLADRTHEFGVHVLKKGERFGLSSDPSVLNLGANSGYQALNLAVHFGAKKIVLLGYDMKRAKDGRMHWHREHPIPTPNLFPDLKKAFATLEVPLAELGVTVINATRDSALECFPKVALEHALVVDEIYQHSDRRIVDAMVSA